MVQGIKFQSYRNGQSIVLVHNGYDVHAEEFIEGVLGIEVLRSLCDYISRETQIRQLQYAHRLCRSASEVSGQQAVAYGRRGYPKGQ